MEICPNCQLAVEPGAVECPACGVVLATLRTGSTPPRPPSSGPVDRYALPVLRLTPKPPAGTAQPAPSPATAPPAAAQAGPPGKPPANPYAPPRPQLGAPVGSTLRYHDTLTPATVEALMASLPWVRTVASVWFGMSLLTAVAGVLLLVSDIFPPGMQSIALICFVEAGVGIAVVLPLKRSAQALDEATRSLMGLSVETYAIEQVAFWRRFGITYLSFLAVILIGIAMGIASRAL